MSIADKPTRLTHEQANILRLRMEWEQVLQFEVVGTPQQRGSKMPVGKKGGGMLLTQTGFPILKDSNLKSKAWMDRVASAAHEAWGERELLNEPLALSVAFRFLRPVGHFGNGRNAHLLKPSSPIDHAQSPDVEKLVRSINDALTGVVWLDDKLVCKLRDIDRIWTMGAEGASITVFRRKPSNPST